MRPESEIQRVERLVRVGLNASEIARLTGIPRSTVRDWLRERRRPHPRRPREPVLELDSLPGAEYSYLLGFYLGDGTITCSKKGVYWLRITTDARYPRIIAECAAAMQAVRPANRVSVRPRRYRAVDICCHSKAWAILFPQHGPGRKHTRKIELAPWQADIVERFPREFLRGLIHSDGCRVLNRVNGKGYPRYFFSQVSDDIRRLFCDTCDQLGVGYTWNNWKTVSIARADSVRFVDSFVGPKA